MVLHRESTPRGGRSHAEGTARSRWGKEEGGQSADGWGRLAAVVIQNR